MPVETNCICNTIPNGYYGPCPAHPERIVGQPTFAAPICPDCGVDHGEKLESAHETEPKLHKDVPYIVDGCACYICRYRRREVARCEPDSAAAKAAERSMPPESIT